MLENIRIKEYTGNICNSKKQITREQKENDEEWDPWDWQSQSGFHKK